MKVILITIFLFAISLFSFDRKGECTKAVNLLSSKTKFLKLKKANKKVLKSMIDASLKLEKEKKAKDLLNCIENEALTKKEIICVNKADSQYNRNKCLAKNTISKTREDLHKNEIKFIKEIVKDIDKNEKSFKKTEKFKMTKSKKGSDCNISIFAKNSVDVKITKTCFNKSKRTEFKAYLMVLPGNSSKLIHSHFIKKVKGKIVEEFNSYSIGSIIKGKETFGKILKKDGTALKKNIGKVATMMEQEYINAAY